MNEYFASVGMSLTDWTLFMLVDHDLIGIEKRSNSLSSHVTNLVLVNEESTLTMNSIVVTMTTDQLVQC